MIIAMQAIYIHDLLKHIKTDNNLLKLCHTFDTEITNVGLLPKALSFRFWASNRLLSVKYFLTAFETQCNTNRCSI